jgi:hypothetical protein
MEVREITTAIVQEITKRDARIYELECVLFRLHSNAAESEGWIRRQVETVLKVEQERGKQDANSEHN